MNIDPDVLRNTLGDLILQIMALQSQLKKAAEQPPAAQPAKPKE